MVHYVRRGDGDEATQLVVDVRGRKGVEVKVLLKC